jgi:hypothetical protein
MLANLLPNITNRKNEKTTFINEIPKERRNKITF